LERVVNTDLKKYLDAKKNEPRLVGDIERHLLTKPAEKRRTDVLHPSEMAKSTWCLRASYFALSGVEVKKERPNLRLQSIFDEGHFIHAKWQNWFKEMGTLHGLWACTVCGETRWGTSPKMCPNCSAYSHFLNYAEVPLVDESLRIAGHSDGWIKGIGNDCLIEIKSIGSGTLRIEAPELIAKADGDLQKAWRSIRRPFRTHLMQGQIYLELMKRMGHKVDEIVFIYELKADQDYREFVVKADFALVDDIFDNARIVVEAVANQTPLECNIGPDCKSCAQFGENNDTEVG
jgi:hypothetical protein